MNSEWSTFQSFQQGQDVLDAINTLAINLKLEGDRLGDETSQESLNEARNRIDSFLKDLQENLSQEEEQEGLILGAGPRHRQFTHRFSEAQQNPRRFQSPLLEGEIGRILSLLQKDRLTDEESTDLLSSLDELKELVEEHVDQDATQLFGEL